MAAWRLERRCRRRGEGRKISRLACRSQHDGKEDRCDGDDVGRVQQPQIRVVGVVDDVVRERLLLVAQAEQWAQFSQRAVGVVDDETGGEGRYQREFTLPDLRTLRHAQLRPLPRCFAQHEPDVLRALFHFAGEIDGRGHDEVGVRLPDLDC